MKEYQERILANKIRHQFNTTNIEKEFLLLYGEVAEAFEAYKKNESIGEELADVAIYLLGLAEILDIDLEKEIVAKMAINEQRVYQKNKNGYVEKI
ncbi:MazG-like family protein [Candidatus Enterococcus willemsii]|uniref:Pyrophosphatase n=1 Tax=Candidatus Enterococcus willemsii TaxID=1857215 RepID=A0ABQ6Z206_9ENTE|nr:MazG-like family protein [Enterococcus sp. CU12B]KAF1305605.1 hypothetical protein BAU17_13360 [Enterococcus sp. CU12B]